MDNTNLNLIFKLSGVSYTIPFKEIEYVMPTPAVTSIPNMPGVIKGAFEYHNRQILLVDIDGVGQQSDSSVLVVKNDGCSFGLVVESVVGAKVLPTEASGNSMPSVPFPYERIYSIAGEFVFKLDVASAVPLGPIESFSKLHIQESSQADLDDSKEGILSKADLENHRAVLSLGNDTIAVDLGGISEFVPAGDCFPTPSSNSRLLGIINLRGRIAAIYDVIGRKSWEMAKEKKQAVYLLYDFEGSGLNGVYVDSVLGVYYQAHLAQTENLPRMKKLPTEFFSGIVNIENKKALSYDLEGLLRHTIALG